MDTSRLARITLTIDVRVSLYGRGMTFTQKSGTGDFDFYVGEWDSVHRRRKEWLADCDEWYEFSATTRCWSVFGGAANVDEINCPDQGFSGLSVRLLDQETGDWSIYWVNSRDGVLGLPPVSGRFEDGVGRFYADEVLQGRSIRTRFTWSDITPDSARWEQAFSPDGGATWEANWVAEFSRRPAPTA
jgi:hypothetical protein